MAKVLQVNFKLAVPAAEWKQIAESVVGEFTDVPGLRWKVWLLDEENGAAGGIYLFDDDAAVQNFLQTPIAQQLPNAPFLTDLSVKSYDVMDRVTAMTRGPVPVAAGS